MAIGAINSPGRFTLAGETWIDIRMALDAGNVLMDRSAHLRFVDVHREGIVADDFVYVTGFVAFHTVEIRNRECYGFFSSFMGKMAVGA